MSPANNLDVSSLNINEENSLLSNKEGENVDTNTLPVKIVNDLQKEEKINYDNSISDLTTEMKESSKITECPNTEMISDLPSDVTTEIKESSKMTECNNNELFSDLPSDDSIPRCFLCQAPNPTSSCPDCGTPSCPSHLKDHKMNNECLPYIVVQREGIGRCVLATRDIKAMEVILGDKPVTVGPNYETEAVCLECLSRVDGSILCELCNLPLCSEKCKKGPKHAPECAVFSKLATKVSIKEYGPGTIAYEYGCITVLRLLSLRDSSPEIWERLQYLMDHDEERRKEKEYWNMFQKNVVDYLRMRGKLSDTYTDEEIHWAIGILRTNAFQVEKPYMAAQGTSGKAIYPTFSFFSHSCVANARYIVMGDDSLVLRAQVDIKKGEEITIQYISFLYGNTKRRKDIKACWMFECCCPRCRSVNELGTNLSSVLCQKCQGTVTPENSDIFCPVWICEDCGAQMSLEQVDELTRQCEAEMYDTYDTDKEKYRHLINKYSTLLHPNNFQMLLMGKYLAEAMRGSLTISEVEEKIRLREQFITAFETVDRGFTKWRGKLQYEIAKTKLFLADMKHAKSEMTKDEFVKEVKRSIDELDFVIKCLQHEPPESLEKKVANSAQSTRRQAKEILEFVLPIAMN